MKKFDIIHENLQTNDYVLYTDGDIVAYLLDNIGEAAVLIQNDTMFDDCDDNMCTGFMLIKSNKATLELFNPATVKRYGEMKDLDSSKKWDDQYYINEPVIKKRLKFKKRPLDFFPNGAYYYKTMRL